MKKKICDFNGKVLNEIQFNDHYTEMIFYMQLVEYWLDNIFDKELYDEKCDYYDIALCKDKIGYKDFERIVKLLDYFDAACEKRVLRYRDYKYLPQLPEIREYWMHKCFLEYGLLDDEEESKKYLDNLISQLAEVSDALYDLAYDLEKLYEGFSAVLK